MSSVTSQRPKVMLLGQIKHADDAWSQIAQVADVFTPKSQNRAQFMEEASSGAFDGVSVVYRTWDSTGLTGRIDAELLSTLPDLKFVCHNGAGYDSIDVAACTARGVRVSNTPTVVDDATADLNIWLLLGALRNLPVGLSSIRAGAWQGPTSLAPGRDPQGKVLGILGMGGIGRNVARKARAFGMRVRYHNRSRLGPELEDGAEYVGFETLLRESDVLSLNLPLNLETRHIIDAPQFAIMKPGIVIVNTSRGAVIREAALVDALASGTVSTVGLDVYEHEPQVHEGLLRDPRVLLVPHMGTWTYETQKKMEEWTIANVYLAATEGRLKSIVPEQKALEASTPNL